MGAPVVSVQGRGWKKASPEERAAAVARVAAGEQVKAVALDHGKSVTTVCKWMDQAGYELQWVKRDRPA